MATEALLRHVYMLYNGSERSVILLVNATEDENTNTNKFQRARLLVRVSNQILATDTMSLLVPLLF